MYNIIVNKKSGLLSITKMLKMWSDSLLQMSHVTMSHVINIVIHQTRNPSTIFNSNVQMTVL